MVKSFGKLGNLEILLKLQYSENYGKFQIIEGGVRAF